MKLSTPKNMKITLDFGWKGKQKKKVFISELKKKKKNGN